jgi:hypothetical protein
MSAGGGARRRWRETRQATAGDEARQAMAAATSSGSERYRVVDQAVDHVILL